MTDKTTAAIRSDPRVHPTLAMEHVQNLLLDVLLAREQVIYAERRAADQIGADWQERVERWSSRGH